VTLWNRVGVSKIVLDVVETSKFKYVRVDWMTRYEAEPPRKSTQNIKNILSVKNGVITILMMACANELYRIFFKN